jgi:hypothetical protein
MVRADAFGARHDRDQVRGGKARVPSVASGCAEHTNSEWPRRPGGPPASGGGCVVRLAKVPKPRVAKVVGVGRVRLAVTPLRARTRVRLSVAARRARVRAVAFTINRRALAGRKRSFSRTVPVASVKPGRHVARVRVTPKRGRARTLRRTLVVRGC